MSISLDQARTIVDAALAHGTAEGFNPLTVAVLDPGGAIVALARQDGSGFLRPDLAVAKASGVLALGMTNRAIAARAADSPEFSPRSPPWPAARSSLCPAACSSATRRAPCSGPSA